jgi:uncharacterized protein (DUF2062 family)
MSERKTGARRRRRTQWHALLRGLRYRLVIPVFRSPHSAEYTARGVANGVFWGLSPTVGLQTIEIGVTWFLGRRVFSLDSSLLQAYIWVWVNNPVTMIPLYYTYYVTGLWLLGDSTLSKGYAGFVEVWTAAAALGWWTGVVAILQAVGAPLFLGAVPYTIVGTLLAYRWTLRVVRRRQQRLRGGMAPLTSSL